MSSLTAPSPFRAIVDFFTSLKLTLACLVFAMVLVFVGTLAQVKLGTHIAQSHYFQSFFVWWTPVPGKLPLPVLPGGHLIGAVLLVNLIAAHIRRFQLTWRKFGIHLTHGGLIVMLAGGLLTDLFQVESNMRLDEGATSNFSEAPRLTELAVIDQSDPERDTVTAISEKRLRRGGTIESDSLPFRVIVREFFQNSRMQMLSQLGEGARPAAENGLGRQIAIIGVPRATAMNERDLVSAVVEILPKPTAQNISPASLGTWLVSNALGQPQTFQYDGKTWTLSQRQERYYKPYSVTLRDFTHERYPGTEIPKDFSSRVSLTDPERGEDREVLIYMNNPLRYRGETYFQSGFDNDDKTSILQVVRNPGAILPYIAVIVVGVGLIYQFGYHLIGFARKRRKALA